MQKKEIKQTNVQMQQGRTRQTESTTKTQMGLAGEGGATICLSISGTDRCTQAMHTMEKSYSKDLKHGALAES